MEPIFFYSDYRLYLQDFYLDKKSKSPQYSYRTFCRIAGIPSPSLYRDVVNKKRNLTKKTIPCFAKGLHLNHEESDYFSTLVLFNQSKNDQERQYLMEALKRFVPGFSRKSVPLNQLAYYSDWYHSALRELSCLVDWRGKYKRLSDHLVPSISAAEARKSIKLLVELGMLEPSPDGRFRQRDPHLTTSSEVLTLSVRALNRNLAKMGMESIDRFKPDERECSNLILGLSKQGYDLLKEEIKEFKRRVVRITHQDDKADQVYCMSMNFFPLSKRPTNV